MSRASTSSLRQPQEERGWLRALAPARHNFATERTHSGRDLECGRAMIPKMRFGWARLPMLVAGVSLASMVAAAAQTPPSDDDPEMPVAEQTETAPDVSDVDIMKDIDVSKLDWSLLNVDASTLSGPAPKGSGALKAAGGADTAWSANERANGTSAVSVKQSITPFWDTRIGADMTVARQGTATTSEQLSEKLANGGSLPQSSGTAWAAITAPGVASSWDKTAGEVRAAPASGQSRLGTSLSKSLPLSEQYSLTLKND